MKWPHLKVVYDFLSNFNHISNLIINSSAGISSFSVNSKSLSGDSFGSISKANCFKLLIFIILVLDIYIPKIILKAVQGDYACVSKKN